jgi:hypothetical protein
MNLGEFLQYGPYSHRAHVVQRAYYRLLTEPM